MANNKAIEPRLKTIGEYLKISSNQKFVVPVYQRAYSWGKEMCGQLWQDILDFSGSGNQNDDTYFFGTVISDCSDDTQISLIDGQQRTTTFLLLTKALQLRLKEVIKESEKITIDADTGKIIKALERYRDTSLEILFKADMDEAIEISDDWSKTSGKEIFETCSMNELYPKELQKIIFAEDFKKAKDAAEKIKYKQKDNKYTNFFKNFKFFHEKLLEMDSLEVKDFAQSFLTKCKVIEIKSWDFGQAITMFNSLNSKGMPLSDADIISADMYAHADGEPNFSKSEFKENWQDIIKLLEDVKLSKVVNIDNVLQQYMYLMRAQQGITEVRLPALRDYYKNNIVQKPKKPCDDLLKIAKLWDKVKGWPLVKLLLQLNENSKLFFVSFLFRYDVADIDNKTYRKEVEAVAKCLIQLFTVLELVETDYSNKKFKSFLVRENVMLATMYPLHDIIQDFNEHIRNEWKADEIENMAKEYEGNKLVYLNEYLYSTEGFDFDANVNIEHIMPASGKDIATIRRNAGIADVAEFDSLVNKLGNKILLEENINKSISNSWFETKKQTSVKEKTGYKDSKYKIALSLVGYKKNLWEVDDIEKATEKAAKRIVDFVFGK